MATVVFADGFDWYSTLNAQPLGRWASQSETVGSPTTAQRPFGVGQSITMAATGANTIYRTPIDPTPTAIRYVQVRHYNTNWPTVSYFTTLGFEKDGTAGFMSEMQWGGAGGNVLANSRIRRGNTTTVIDTATDSLPADAWLLFEWQVNITNAGNGTGDTDVWVDEASVHNIDATDLSDGAVTTDVLYVNFDIADSTSAEYWDDLILTTGDRLAPARVFATAANADTAQEDFTLSSGTDSYAAVDNLPTTNDTGTYIHSSTVGHKTRVVVPPPSYQPDAIYAAIPVFAARTTGGGTMRANLKVGATTATGSTVTLVNSATHRVFAPDVYNENPDTTAAWTWDDISGGVEVEVEVVTNSSGEVRVSSIGVDWVIAEAEFTPPPPPPPPPGLYRPQFFLVT